MTNSSLCTCNFQVKLGVNEWKLTVMQVAKNKGQSLTETTVEKTRLISGFCRISLRRLAIN